MKWTADDGDRFRAGTHAHLHTRLGAFPATHGARFAVWAPNAAEVSVIGPFNDWSPGASPLDLVDERSGIWAGFVPNAAAGELYKYEIGSKHRGYRVAKADPFALRHEPGGTASVVWERDAYGWTDAAWMQRRAATARPTSPIAIYEVHLGSWMRVPEEGNRALTYREIAPKLVEHVTRLGFTHVELMPVTEHPFYGSWGYETTGYFAATSRYGTPEDLMALVDELHRAGVGVLLDWVPAHFPSDEHGLVYFDGTPLYEHADRRLGFQPEWNTSIFDFGKPEVRSFLLSSALSWLERFHIDGLRVDGVASMLYRDYARKPGEWAPNVHGGREYLEAIELLKSLNATIARDVPDAVTFAEESTAFPKVTGAITDGGLGFTYKWDMGWMHDTLQYLARDPIDRRANHRELTMRGLYAFSERFVLPLSHDEVVYGKRSLLGKLPGDRWQKLATLRLLYTYMYSQPGKKLLFMGNELAQWNEWNHEASLDWHLLREPAHAQVQLLVGVLNHLYRTEAALHELDCEPAGFHWLDADDADRSVLVYERIARSGDRIICALNFTPVVRSNYRIGVTRSGQFEELLNTDAAQFGGSGQGNLGRLEASPVRAHRREMSINAVLPPLGAVLFR